MHDVIAPGGAVRIDTSLFWKTNYDFLLVVSCNYASIMYRFVYNEAFSLTRNDVTAESPPGGAISDWYKFILEEKYDFLLLLKKLFLTLRNVAE